MHKYDSDDIPFLEVDCWNHLRNVYLGGMKKSLSTLLGNKMREGLNEIDSQLRVSTSTKSVLCAVDKDFILCDNYTKGHKELF